MAVEITCITKDSGNHENPHTAIKFLGWYNHHTRESGRSTRLEVYDFIQKGNQAYVKDSMGNVAYLTTAITAFGTKYVKTIPDHTKRDNLLQLPECIGIR